MKKIFVITAALALLGTGRGFAQAPETAGETVEVTETSENIDTLNGRIGITDSSGKQVVVIENNEESAKGFTVRLGGFKLDFESNGRAAEEFACETKDKRVSIGFLGDMKFGFTGLSSTSYSMYPDNTPEFMRLNSGKSTSFSFNVVSAEAKLNKKGSLSLFGGIGLKWNDYVFSDRYTIVKHDGMVWPVEIGPEKDGYKKSKLTVFSLNIPVMLRVELGKGFFFGGGVYGDLTLKQHTKVKFPKDKHYGDFYVRQFQMGVTAEIGWKNISVFCNYNLTPMFDSGKGPRTYPYTIGIAL